MVAVGVVVRWSLVFVAPRRPLVSTQLHTLCGLTFQAMRVDPIWRVDPTWYVWANVIDATATVVVGHVGWSRRRRTDSAATKGGQVCRVGRLTKGQKLVCLLGGPRKQLTW